MQTPKPNAMQTTNYLNRIYAHLFYKNRDYRRAKRDLFRIIKELQKQDAEQGFGVNTYNRFLCQNPIGLQLYDILEDALNCNLITNEEYDNIRIHYSEIRKTLPYYK